MFKEKRINVERRACADRRQADEPIPDGFDRRYAKDRRSVNNRRQQDTNAATPAM